MRSTLIFRVLAERRDGTRDELGQLTMTADTYGTTTADAATSAALAELQEAPGGLLRWRSVMLPAADLRLLRVELVTEYADEAAQ